MKQRRFGRIAVAAIAGAAVALTAAPAASAHTGCYYPSGDRQLRIIPQADSCKKGERRISWSSSSSSSRGERGARGARGLRGLQGVQGTAGAPGPQGPQGVPGLPGAPGAPGETGPAGAAGPAGPAGPAGSDGAPGPVGPAGSDGAVGPAGPAGADGNDGATGPAGPEGPPGQDGAGGVTGHGYAANTAGGLLAVVLGGTPVPMGNVQLLDGVMADGTSTIFTVAEAGVYKVEYDVNLTAGVLAGSQLVRNGAPVPGFQIPPILTKSRFSASGLVSLAAGNTLSVQLYGVIAAATLESGVGAALTIVRVG